MSRRRDERPRWDDGRWHGGGGGRGRGRDGRDGRERDREPVWEMRRSTSPDWRVRRDRDRDPDRGRDRYDRDRDRARRRSPAARRSPQWAAAVEEQDIPPPPSPPTISAARRSPRSMSRSRSRSPSESSVERAGRSPERGGRSPERGGRSPERSGRSPEAPAAASPGDWFCKCGLYNFKRRQVCYRRHCSGRRAEGAVLGAEAERPAPPDAAGITKKLLFRRLDALTTEEKILDSIKERCSRAVLDSIAGITIGRETLTGASKCLAYVNFNSIADSTAAHGELLALDPPLQVDGREPLITFYNEPKKIQKPQNPNYSAYYGQMSAYSGQQQPALSEADRVNAAAAVAQSAISAAAARQMSWTPVAVPTFIVSTSQSVPVTDVPSGDGKTVYPAPDVRTFLYDETSGYYYDPASGLYYDGNTQYFFNSRLSQYMYWDASSSTYVAATQKQQNTEQPKLPNPPQATAENTIAKEPEEKKKKDKEDKVKVAKKIAKDMERWARTLNQKKENARSNVVVEQPLDTSASKGTVDIGFSVLSAGPSLTHVRELSPPPVCTDDFLMKKVAEPVLESDEGIIDWAKLTCLLCKRRFPSMEVLTKHKTLSDLHKQNLLEYRKKNDLLPQTNGYRDRAAERRMKFGEDETPIVRKRYEPPDVMHPPMPPAPPPSVVDTIGGKMLQKMGWSEGRGLGKEEQGRIAPIEAEQRPSLAGLGQKRGIYTPTPGETYRDTVKKLMIARYKEVVGQEEGK